MDMPVDLSFDDWTLRRRPLELLRNGVRVRLQEQPLQVLDELLAAPGEIVPRERLIARLWPKRIVEFDAALNAAVRRLRSALEDEAGTPRYIETLPRKGYRFIGTLHKPSAAQPQQAEPRPPLPDAAPPEPSPHYPSPHPALTQPSPRPSVIPRPLSSGFPRDAAACDRWDDAHSRLAVARIGSARFARRGEIP